jgi:hypothetical protein
VLKGKKALTFIWGMAIKSGPSVIVNGRNPSTDPERLQEAPALLEWTKAGAYLQQEEQGMGDQGKR